MLALCDQTFGHLIEAIGEIEKTVDDPLERVRRFGEAYARFGLTHPDEYRLVFMGPTSRNHAQVGHRAPIDDPTRPGVGGAIFFKRLVAIAVPGRGVGHQAQLPAGHLRRTLLDGHPRPGGGLHHEAQFPWSDCELLITACSTST